MEKFHQFFSHLDGLLARVRNPKFDQKIGKAHNTQPDLPVGECDILDLGQRVSVDFYDIIQ